MAEFPQIQAPSFALSDESKERLRKVDAARPYAHRAAIMGLPAMAAANFMLPQMKRRGLTVGAIGAAGAGIGLMDRKIEQLAEEHEELRPTLKNYARGNPSSGVPMAAKTASVSDRVRRNQNELAAAFPMTMAQRTDLQKEALMLDPKSTAKGLSAAIKAMKGIKPTLVGAGVGAAGGALADGENRGRGALVGALAGGAMGGAATLATRHYAHPLQRASVNIGAMGKTPASVTDVMAAAKAPNAKFDSLAARLAKRPAPPEGAAASGAAEAGREVTGSAPMQKRAGMNTMNDAHRAIGGRPPYALLTMGGETSNDAVINQMLRALFANTDAMRKATEDQVLAAFPLSAPYSYGRHRAIGRTADDIKAEIALAYTPTQR